MGNAAGDLGKVGVHRRRVDEGQDQARRKPARGTDRTKRTGPLAAGVAGRAGSCAAPGPEAGQGARLADPCFVLKPDLERLVPCLRRDSGGYRLGKVFLNAIWSFGGLRWPSGPTSDVAGARTARKPGAASCLGLRCACATPRRI